MITEDAITMPQYRHRALVWILLTIVCCGRQALPQPAEEAHKMQIVGAKNIHSGDAFIFWMRFPKPGFLGYRGPAAMPATKIPKEMQDYEQQLLRVCILGAGSEAKGRIITARVDEVSIERRLWIEGRYNMTFEVRDDGVNVVCDQANGSAALFPFHSYPAANVIGSAEQVTQHVAGNGEVIEEICRPTDTASTVSVEVRHLDVVQKEPERRVLKFVDSMKWNAGTLFFSELIRRDADGHMMMECVMVDRQTRQPIE